MLEVQFGESSTGAAVVQGAMVGADQARASYGGRQNSMESREQTIAKGRGRIRRIAMALRIPDYISDSACEWFKLALTNNFVQGRRSQNVLATCLYVACRKEKTHHMLIDFSSLLQIPVYSLGATFLKMVKALCITKLPLADPSIFIQHFAEKLGFNDRCTKVVRDAVKLSQRMSKDWIHEGRRPAGIAGACVLLAARMNNFRRSHAEIVAVAHVAEETLQRRLNEFKKTKSGELTISDFRTSHGTQASNPPSFDKNRKKETRLKERLASKHKTLRKLINAENETPEEEPEETESLQTVLETVEASEIMENGETNSSAGDEYAEPTLVSYTDDADRKKTDVLTDYTLEDSRRKRLPLYSKENEQRDKQMILTRILGDCQLSKDEISQAIGRIMSRTESRLQNAMYVTPGDGKEEISERIDLDKPRNLNRLDNSDVYLKRVKSDEELDLDDDDDVVLELQLLESERAIKERIWTGLNHDFLVEQEKKRLKIEADELTGNTSAKAPRKKRPRTAKAGEDSEIGDAIASSGIDELTGEPLSAADSAKKFLQKKAFSKKINYTTLGDLFETSAAMKQ